MLESNTRALFFLYFARSSARDFLQPNFVIQVLKYWKEGNFSHPSSFIACAPALGAHIIFWCGGTMLSIRGSTKENKKKGVPIKVDVKTKQNKTKQNKTKQSKAKQSKAKQNKQVECNHWFVARTHVILCAQIRGVVRKKNDLISTTNLKCQRYFC